MAANITISYAEEISDRYYIEIGDETTQEGAEQQWKSFNQKYKKLLTGLTFVPKSILQENGKVVTRVQAGYLSDKPAAQKICKQFFLDNIPCFVLEGAQQAPRSVTSIAAGVSEHALLPWLSDRPAEITEDEVQESTIQDNKDKSAYYSAEQEGTVEVAEAVRVPLTEVVLPAKTLDDSPTTTNPKETGWLNVNAFITQEAAATFWQNVRATVPSLAAGLRVRTVQSGLVRNRPVVSLNVGPFANNEDANEFCEKGVKTIDDSLVCQFDTDEPQGESQAVILHSQADRYQSRRQTDKKANYTSAAVQGIWIQVASAENQKTVLEQWEKLKVRHADIVGGMKSRVSAVLSNPPIYVVRVGPLHDAVEAADVCQKLGEKGVSCKVISGL